MKSLEASEQEAKLREENFAELMREYTAELKEVNALSTSHLPSTTPPISTKFFILILK